MNSSKLIRDVLATSLDEAVEGISSFKKKVPNKISLQKNSSSKQASIDSISQHSDSISMSDNSSFGCMGKSLSISPSKKSSPDFSINVNTSSSDESVESEEKSDSEVDCPRIAILFIRYLVHLYNFPQTFSSYINECFYHKNKVD